uniref:F-box domain-containing protein n=1 Tax=Parascaris univalens TaxID=6257 RepID=A0A915BY10_PARUN
MASIPETFLFLLQKKLAPHEAEKMRRVCKRWNAVFIRATPSITVLRFGIFDRFIDITLQSTHERLRFAYSENIVCDCCFAYPLRSLFSFARHIKHTKMLLIGFSSSYAALKRMDSVLEVLAEMQCSRWKLNELSIWLVDDLQGAESQLSIIPMFANNVTDIALLAQRYPTNDNSQSLLSELERNKMLSRYIDSITNLKVVALSPHLIQQRIPKSLVNSLKRAKEVQIFLNGVRRFERIKSIVHYCIPMEFRLSTLINASLRRFDIIIQEEVFVNKSFDHNVELLHDVFHILQKWIHINDGIMCFFRCSYYVQQSYRKYSFRIRNPSL